MCVYWDTVGQSWVFYFCTTKTDSNYHLSMETTLLFCASISQNNWLIFVNLSSLFKGFTTDKGNIFIT